MGVEHRRNPHPHTAAAVEGAVSRKRELRGYAAHAALELARAVGFDDQVVAPPGSRGSEVPPNGHRGIRTLDAERAGLDASGEMVAERRICFPDFPDRRLQGLRDVYP